MSGYHPPPGNLSYSTPQQTSGTWGEGSGNSSYQQFHLSSARSYSDLNYLFGIQDPTMLPSKGSRNRRKSAPGSDHVKHRRTRSGCYTCRARRVKCDETHPICERCRKGGRDCTYPEPAKLNKSASGGSSSQAGQSATHESPGSSTEDTDENEPVGDHLEVILDGDEGEQSSSKSQSPSKSATQLESGMPSLSEQKSITRPSSETPSLVQDKGLSPSPSTEGSLPYPTYPGPGASTSKKQSTNLSSRSESSRSDWSHLPQDLQFYLGYFYENITPYHYTLKLGFGDFLRTHFLDAALQNDALLHAVVGFSAFQRTLHTPGGRIQDFLQYYNKAVSFLLKSLRRGERHNIGTLLVMLQLATIEEFLGDWINLLGHQKAAYEILTELFTPETVVQTEFTRTILAWYARFDVFAGLMGGFETVLSRNWFSAAEEHYRQKAQEEPENIVGWKIEQAAATVRLLAMDMSILFAKMGKGEIPPNQFLIENEKLRARIADWKEKMDPSLQNPQWIVKDFSGARPRDPNDIVDPYVPGALSQGPNWDVNLLRMDYYSLVMMHRHQTSLILREAPSKELGTTAYATCQLFEAIEYWPESPRGSIIACQASLAMASLFLPRDEKHNMWCRRKLAVIESSGYIYPLTFRTKMTLLFQDPSCMHWWLPNDEAYPPIIRSIRQFVQERTSQARDSSTEDLRDIKAIFSSMNINEGQGGPPGGPPGAPPGAGAGAGGPPGLQGGFPF